MSLEDKVKIRVLSNGKAKQNRGGLWDKFLLWGRRTPERLENIANEVGKQGYDVGHRFVEDISEYSEIIRQYAEKGVDIVYVNGGDGTLRAVMTEAAKQSASFAISPMYGGTMNVSAKALNVPRRDGIRIPLTKWKVPLPQKGFLRDIADGVIGRWGPDYVLRDAVHRFGRMTKREFIDSHILNKKVLKIDIDEDTHYGFLFGVGGIIERFFDLYEGNKEGDKPGLWKFAKITAAGLFSVAVSSFYKTDFYKWAFEPSEFRLFSTLGSRCQVHTNTQYFGAAMSSINGELGPLQVFHGVQEHDPFMYFISGLSDVTPFSIFRYAAKVAFGKRDYPSGILESYRDRVIIVPNQELGITINGDCWSTDKEIRITTTTQLFVKYT